MNEIYHTEIPHHLHDTAYALRALVNHLRDTMPSPSSGLNRLQDRARFWYTTTPLVDMTEPALVADDVLEYFHRYGGSLPYIRRVEIEQNLEILAAKVVKSLARCI